MLSNIYKGIYKKVRINIEIDFIWDKFRIEEDTGLSLSSLVGMEILRLIKIHKILLIIVPEGPETLEKCV